MYGKLNSVYWKVPVEGFKLKIYDHNQNIIIILLEDWQCARQLKLVSVEFAQTSLTLAQKNKLWLK